MRHAFVPTSNVHAFMTALGELKQRGAEETCLLVVDGKPGRGKTATLTWWCAQTGSVYVRAKAEWTPPWMLREILGALNVRPEHSFERMYAQVLEALGSRARAAERDGEDFGLVIDEADHIVRSAKMVDTIRDISDMLEIPTILVGMGRIRSGLTRTEQTASRVFRYVPFAEATADDAAKLVQGLCEVEVAPDLVAFLHRASGGLAREIKEGIAAIERFGKRRAAAGEEGPVTLAGMSGQPLMLDRRTGQPITVRG